MASQFKKGLVKAERGSALGTCRLDSLGGHPFQIVPLNITNCIFAFNVIKHRRLI